MNETSIATQDISQLSEPFLTKKAKEVLKNKALTSVVKNYSTGEVFLATYFGVIVNMSDIDDGIKLVAGRINELAHKNQIHSCLSHFIKLDLSPETTGYFDKEGNPKEMQTVVMCYVLVPETIYKELEKETIHLRQDIMRSRDEG